jgi:type VI secretion system protein ImpH
MAMPPIRHADTGEPVPGASVPDWLRLAQQEPWRYELFALLRRLCASAAARPRIGEARLPRQEFVRLGQQPSLAFAPREIAQVRAGPRQVRVQCFGLGMLGPNGALPLHYTEFVRERLHASRDSALADFLDLFHHRAMTLLYRAWAQGQAAAALDRPDDERFTRYVASLVGDTSRQPASAWPAHARWASAAQRLRPVRTAQGLRSALRDYLRVEVQIDEFELQWLRIQASERSRLGARDRGARLGDAAILGAWVPDRQGRFRIRVGPLSLAGFLDLLPGAGGRALPALSACVRGFVGRELDWSLLLLVRAVELRFTALGGPQALARDAWLGDPRAAADAAGLVAVQFDHPIQPPSPRSQP